MTRVATRTGRPWRRIALAGVSILAGLAGLAFLVVADRQPPPPKLPDPNAYDIFVRAGKGLVGRAPDPDKADAVALRAFVGPNRAALALAVPALGGQGRVPLGLSREQFDASIADLGAIRQLGRLLAAEGLLAELEGRPGEAMWAYLNAARLGPLSARGGFMIHELAGFAIQMKGFEGLERVRAQLDARECRGLVANLESIDAAMDSPASVIARERAWFRATADLPMRVAFALNAATLEKQVKPAYRAYETASRRNALRLRQLLALTAVRAYYLEVGADPPGLKALVPRYLAAVPLDPDDGRPLVYRDEPGEGIRVGDAPDDSADGTGTTAPAPG